MIVVDASVLVNALTDDGQIGRTGRAELSRDSRWVVPEHCVVETFSAVRGRYRARLISDSRAEDALRALASAAFYPVPSTALLPRMWQLRENVSGYDAAYIAAAEILDCPLVTADQRLSTAPGVRCEVRVALPPER